MRSHVFGLLLLGLGQACADGATPRPPVARADAGVPAPPTTLDGSSDGAAPTTRGGVPTAGFLEVPPRDVTLHGAQVHIAATGRLFYNLRPADSAPQDKPVIFLFNGFAAEIVRAFGTGPTTVAPGGDVVANPSSLTAVANLVYLEPRQSGYSYDLHAGDGVQGPTADDCSPDVFNEYVDAADVLLAALTFLDQHPDLRGPVYWMGESFAGVRITWILTYVRGRWDAVPFADPTLAAKVEASTRGASLHAGQILLEAWLAGGPEADAIAAVCADPTVAADVAGGADAGAACAGEGACPCADQLDRSLYNFGYTVAEEDTREAEASSAHIDPDRAAALLGIPLSSIPGIGLAERSRGFKCLPPDATVPDEGPLVAALGALPLGQAYYVPFSPLLPGKELSATTLDWRTVDLEAQAFVDNLHDVPAFLTRGARDLVVPTSALAPALRTTIGASRVDTSAASRIGVSYPDGEHFVDLFDYPNAGHMITMVQPVDFASDLEAWLAGR
jgi:hypothetical protein